MYVLYGQHLHISLLLLVAAFKSIVEGVAEQCHHKSSSHKSIPILIETGPAISSHFSHDAICRYGYLDFLKYAWSAQMINQFETSNTRVLEGQTVRSVAITICTMLPAHAPYRCNT